MPLKSEDTAPRPARRPLQGNQHASGRSSAGCQAVNSKGRLPFPPISTNSTATHFSDSGKYANMSSNKAQKCHHHPLIYMLLKALIVRSTTQKDLRFSAPAGRDIARIGDALLSLVWNGQAGS